MFLSDVHLTYFIGHSEEKKSWLILLLMCESSLSKPDQSSSYTDDDINHEIHFLYLLSFFKFLTNGKVHCERLGAKLL